MMTMIRLLFCCALLAFPATGCIGGIRPKEPVFVYTLPSNPPFLTETMALDYARRTLVRQGYSSDNWQIVDGDFPMRTAPDGRKDQYLNRWSPHAARVLFQNGQQTRTYQIELRGNLLTCSLFRGL